ncbi:MAG: glycosyltransferase family 4 protein [Spirochaetaceae bacterium]|nr:glycosyltransferase family 4 protein [Spirochaetaceae bacterium]
MTPAPRADTFAGPARGRPLRIALVIERFAPGTGGVENVAWRVAHELARGGLDVSVLAREVAAEAAVDAIAESRPGVLRLRAPRAWQPLRVLAFSAAAARAAREGRFDVVHAFSRTRHQHLYRAGGGSHADYLEGNHGALGRSLRQLSPRHRVLLDLERAVFRDPSQRIQCASHALARRLQERHGIAPERLFVLPNAVDADRFGSDAALAAGARLRRELDPSARCVFLLPGSGWRRKGLTTLLEALALRPDPGLRVWVAGRDDPRPWRAAAARRGDADRVRFLGPRNDMPAVYAAADAVVLPTRYDPFANVTLEAAAAGRAVVTTAANGASEWLGNDVLVLRSARDARALARAMDALVDPDRRRALGARARRRAQALDWASHAGALVEEYERIVRTRRTRAPASPPAEAVTAP